jgi:hypothetical protein
MSIATPSPDAIETEVFGPPESPICYIYRFSRAPTRTVFATPQGAQLQAGFIVHAAGHEITRHIHRPIERVVHQTAEVLLVLTGSCEADIFNSDRALLATRILNQGDVMVTVAGGHGFRMRENAVLFEIRQGPYFGPSEKEPF